MKVFIDGVERFTWEVSTGLRGYDTPSGKYTARSMNEIWYSKQWDDAPMPHAIFFTRKGHAIHGTEETRWLGRPASHGCVRLEPENATTLFTQRLQLYYGGSAQSLRRLTGAITTPDSAPRRVAGLLLSRNGKRNIHDMARLLKDRLE